MPKRVLEEANSPFAPKRMKLDIYEGKATLQDIPIEILWKIIEYLDPDDFLNLRNLCSSISKTLNVMFYHYYHTIPRKISSARKSVLNKFYSLDEKDQALRLNLVEELLCLVWIKTELIALESIIRRYNVNSHSLLFAKLWPILKEISTLVSTLVFKEAPSVKLLNNPSSILPLWFQFLETFDKELEPCLEQPVPFEIKVIDILSSCPAANTNVMVRKKQDGTLDLKAFFQIQDVLSEASTAKIELYPPKAEDKVAVLKMFRIFVRNTNWTYLTSIYNEISEYIKDNEALSKMTLLTPADTDNEGYGDILSLLYKPLMTMENNINKSKLFVRRSTYNVSCNFLECFLERTQLKISETPLIVSCPHLFNIKKQSSQLHSSFKTAVETTNIENPSFTLSWFRKL